MARTARTILLTIGAVSAICAPPALAAGVALDQATPAVPEQACVTAPVAGGEGETRAISTSRSNIKRPGTAADASRQVADGDAPTAAEAIINTSRSNIKRPRMAADASEPVADGDAPTAAEAIISTSRSNIKRPARAVDASGPVADSDTPTAAEAPISTSRSNKKHGMALTPGAGGPIGACDADSARQESPAR